MSLYFKAEKIELIRSGEQYFDLLLQLIRDSRQIIHLQTYIFDDDRTGQLVLNELCQAASRGIKVYLLLDAFGSANFNLPLQTLCLKSGIHFRFFAPVLSTENIFAGRRLHHKILSVDGTKGLIGGINIADKYHGAATVIPWLDFALYTEAPDNVFLKDLCEDFYFKRLSNRKLHYKSPASTDLSSIRYRRNDWIRGKNEIHRSYREQLGIAEQEVDIVASYFLPGQKFRKLLQTAVQRGVKVRLIIAGQSDAFSVRYAENYLYDFYLRHHIEVYEWRDSVMHGKAMIVDQSWCTIGSYNLNFLSHFASIELNAESRDALLIKSFKEQLEFIRTNCCEHIDLQKHRLKRNLILRLLRWLSYSIFRIMRSILAGFSRRRKKQFH